MKKLTDVRLKKKTIYILCLVNPCIFLVFGILKKTKVTNHILLENTYSAGITVGSVWFVKGFFIGIKWQRFREILIVVKEIVFGSKLVWNCKDIV